MSGSIIIDPQATPSLGSTPGPNNSAPPSIVNSAQASPLAAAAQEKLQGLNISDGNAMAPSGSAKKPQFWDVGNGVQATETGEWVTTDADGQRISSGGSRKSSRTRELAHETAESGVSDTEDEREGTKMEILVGDVAGRVAILIDDMIDTGRTLALAAKTLKDAGASEVYAIIAHGLLSGRATDLIRRLELEKLVVSTLCAFFCARENGC